MAYEDWYEKGLRFTCTQCGNCCSGPPGYVWFTSEEGHAIAKHIGLSYEQFLEKHAVLKGRAWSLRDHETAYGHDCTFLVRDDKGQGRCSIYEERPMQCRTWPFWPDNLQSKTSWRQAAARCPGMKAGMEGNGQFYPVEQIRIVRDRMLPTG